MEKEDAKMGDFHCGTLSKWHLEILFRIIKNDCIIVARDQWELQRQGWGQGGRIGGGGKVTLKDLDHRQNKG